MAHFLANESASDDDVPALPPTDQPVDGNSLHESLAAAPLRIQSSDDAPAGYADYMTSRIVAVRIADDKVYHVHSALLCRESQHFQTSLTSSFKEASSSTISLNEEVEGHFAQFIQFLYQPGWQPPSEEKSNLVYLAYLYSMGERLIANRFQDIILKTFDEQAKSRAYHLAEQDILTLLTIARDCITERPYPNDDALREWIFRIAAHRLLSLREHADFNELLMENEDLARHILLRAGPVQLSPPNHRDRMACTLNGERRKSKLHTHGW